jgi:antitoxin component YwqK of YwqJK toxin-antitoxin module
MSEIFVYGEFVDMKDVKSQQNIEKKEDDVTIHQTLTEKNINGIYDCCICTDEYSENQIVFPCKTSKNHSICKLCFEDWKENSAKSFKEMNCPICRVPIPKNGKYTFYYPNHIKRQEVEYIDNDPNGFAQIWRPDGTLEKKCYLKNNKYHGLCEEYNENGLLFRRIQYDDNVIHGLFEEYYPNEFIKVRCNYHKGFIQGIYQLFYNTSLLFLECECGPIGGKINGTLQVWNEDGQLIEKYQCKNARINIMYDDDHNVSYSRKSGSFIPVPLE